MPKKAALLTLLLLAGVQMLQAEVFKAGDLVEAHLFDQWLPCKVFKVEENWLVPGAAGIRGYTVTCVINAASGPVENFVAVADVRARQPNAEDKSVAAETAAALARQPKGNTVGAKYGTREPRACGSRTAPAHGAPSAEQAKQYVICELERGDGERPLLLVTNVQVQVAPVSHPPNLITREITAARIDPREPVWDIRGSFTSYQCTALASLIAQNDFARTHNLLGRRTALRHRLLLQRYVRRLALRIDWRVCQLENVRVAAARILNEERSRVFANGGYPSIGLRSELRSKVGSVTLWTDSHVLPRRARLRRVPSALHRSPRFP